EAGEDVHQGGLPAAGGTHDGDELVLRHVQAHAAERLEALPAHGEVLGDFLDLDLPRVALGGRTDEGGVGVHRRSCHWVARASIASRVRSMTKPKMPMTRMPTKMVGRS